MIISLIGMSGTGKSYWSKKLEEEGFLRFSVDELIEAKLKKRIDEFKSNGITAIARWMGHPYEVQYKKTSKAYLACEQEAMLDIFSAIKKPGLTGKNIVIDTTGSIIYMDQQTLKTLTDVSTIIYFKVTDEMINNQLQVYINDPKPVIWGSVFKKKKGEVNMDALARCYPALLKYRASRYKNLADITLDAAKLRSPSYTIENFINRITNNKNF